MDKIKRFSAFALKAFEFSFRLRTIAATPLLFVPFIFSPGFILYAVFFPLFSLVAMLRLPCTDAGEYHGACSAPDGDG
ncbi:hypothetical protein [Oxalicibacterium faecigallinarum]|uniref:hypothetical protein n=1 Tax=Oxalicibacterium faecigallinarum TaxID=573741 RepID=UPI001E463055|nr:hypothetical protein [Oxalicibacterium faecigallinarum]